MYPPILLLYAYNIFIKGKILLILEVYIYIVTNNKHVKTYHLSSINMDKYLKI
jgi:hypothetical protein